ncbi:hypothetical protein OS493_035452 [Desmophyllum pertusum]|uniref:Uncharacterized protein n=1 Tax=Desmophyllum pertusum TaxID=174260 RepID=A0A9W9Z798_9CNID|nr:hypothetical protein OS493_035452 [Desmophyllum pertusum]
MDDFASSLGGSMKAPTLPNNAFDKSNRSLNSLNSASSSSLRPGAQTRASRRQSAMYIRGNTPPERRTTNSAAYFILGDGLGRKWNKIPKLSTTGRDWPNCSVGTPRAYRTYRPRTRWKLKRDPTSPGKITRSKREECRWMLPRPNLTTPGSENRRKAPPICSRPRNIGGSSLPKSKSAPNITPAKQPRSQRIAAKMQSAFGSLRSRSNENISTDTAQDDGNSSRRESVAYNIEISPPKARSGIARRRTIARSTGTSRLLSKKSKDSLKKSKTQHLGTSAIQERQPLRSRDFKRNVK